MKLEILPGSPNVMINSLPAARATSISRCCARRTGALHGTVSYPRRRIGVVHDRRRFAVSPVGAERVDFWACDAIALPFAAASSDLVAAANVLDCVAEPRRLLASLADVLRHDSRLLLATPYDRSIGATPMET